MTGEMEIRDDNAFLALVVGGILAAPFWALALLVIWLVILA